MESKLTARETVAMHVLQGLLARPIESSTFAGMTPKSHLINDAFEFADLFMSQVDKDRPGPTGTVETA